MRVTSPSANRKLWNRTSAEYQQRHNPQIGAAPRLWGMFSIPDAELGALGDVTGQRVLELGCGAGQWSRSLLEEAGQIVGFDLSEAQIGAARQAMRGRYPLVQGAAQQLPFADSSFDVVLCDHGALSWAPPAEAVPEAARVLRGGGRLVFSIASPWLETCYDYAADRVTSSLRQDYFGLYAIPEEGGAASYTLTYGEWVRVLRSAGLVIDDLIEPRPGPQMRSTYLDFDPPDWASHWPCELLWVTHKP
ncbi:MAG TPA: class I SAM-dependent methyltransferase [Streptosporangiaceae bacterium]